MQTEASRKIALFLRGELSRTDTEALQANRARDFQTFDLYSRGAHAASLRTERGLTQSIEFYRQAIERDPKYALAHAGLAEAYTGLGTYGFMARREAYARAADAANKAVALDDSLVEAHLALAYAHKNRFEWSLAEERFKRALQLKPAYARSHHWYSIYLMQQGRFAESIAEAKAAISLDPLSIGANLQLASALLMARRYEDAISQWQRALQQDPTFVNAYRGITSAYTYLGLYDRALAAAADAARHAPLGSEDQELKADLGYLLAVSGRRTEALRIVRQLEERFDKTGEEVGGSIAAIYIGLGRTELAFQWLTKARDRRDPEMGFLKIDPRWDPLRKDPRFSALLTSVGFSS
jgi:tetratricopeptide (TPR) repeat protein